MITLQLQVGNEKPHHKWDQVKIALDMLNTLQTVTQRNEDDTKAIKKDVILVNDDIQAWYNCESRYKSEYGTRRHDPKINS